MRASDASPRSDFGRQRPTFSMLRGDGEHEKDTPAILAGIHVELLWEETAQAVTWPP